MLKYTTEQLASLIALPIIIILLCWTVVIFHKNRRKWGPYDIPIVSVLILSILRNFTVFGYTLTIIFTFKEFNTEYCSVITWLFNSIHTFQASSLTSIAVIGLFSAKLHRQSQNLRTFLTSTHIVYHLFCLTTLCACVGVAAILAQKDGGFGNIFADSFDISPCMFLPFELDIKFNVFIIVLHVFLATISFISFLIICYNYYKIKKEGFDYIKKSNSDLSELSNNFHGVNSNVNDTRGFYDTYTINRNNNYCTNKDTWTNNSHYNNSEVLSNNSTTVSSTNSRRPCIIKQQEEEVEVEVRTTGLETMHPVLIVCYLFYHLPLIVLCIHPRLINPWPVAGIALWLGLVQDLLIPIGLGIVDSRFCSWVTDVYRCSNKRTNEKLPQVGLDGKFRPFGLTSQPQSLDLSQHDRSKTLQQVEHRFPITNGSLYTSIDGRLPVIHNYRRHKEFRTGTLKQPQDLQSSNVALHSSHLNRRELESTPPQNNYSPCTNCKVDQCPSHSDLHHLSPQYVHRKLSFLQASQNNVFSSNGSGERKAGENSLQRNPNHQNCLFVGNRRLQNTQNSFRRNQILLENNSRHPKNPYGASKRLSQSQESLNHLYYGIGDVREAKMGDNVFYHRSEMNIASPSFNLKANLNNHMIKNSRNLVRLNKMRLSRSEESLTDFHMEPACDKPSNLQKHLSSPQNHQNQNQNSYCNNHHHISNTNQYSSDEEEFCFKEHNDHHMPKDYDSMSSSNSITTEANCDFEFYQAEESLFSNNSKVSDKSVHSRKTSSDFYFEIPNINAVDVRPPPNIITSVSRKDKHNHVSNTRITRTNSKRSLENFQAFVEETITPKELEMKRKGENISKVVILHRSNSYTTLEDKRRKKQGNNLSRSNSKISECVRFEDLEKELNMKNKKIKSVEYLPNSINNAIYIEDLKNNNNAFKYGSSVPDFKKVFISEYI